MRRRFLSVLLSLCLALGLLPTAAFAQGKSYVALGDSITAGYGLSEGEEQAFPKLVAATNGYTLTNLAKDGATSEDLLEVVEAQANADALKNADLITITIGGNDLMGALYEYLANEYNETYDSDISASDVQSALVGEHATINQMAMVLFAAGKLSNFTQSEEAGTALTKFTDNLAAIVTAIKTANQDVTIIVANQYNPYTSFEGTMLTLVASVFDEGLEQLNGAIDAGARTGAYSVADVYGAFDQADENPCNAYFASTSDMNLDFHPNAYGHGLIADVVGALLPGSEEPGGGEQPVSPVADLWVNGENVLAAENHTVQCGDGTAKYDATTNTLTLDNATITEAHYNDGNIEFTGDLTIVLIGENTITGDSNFYGIGTSYGSLTIRGEDPSAKLTIEGCSFGIHLEDNLNISNSTLDITGTLGGIRAYSDISISGSTVTAYSEIGSFCGIYASAGSLTIDSTSTVTAVSENEASFGASATEGILIDGKTYACFGPEMVVENGTPTKGLRSFGVVVDGKPLSDSQSMACGSGTAKYDASTNTLTLTNAMISSGYAYYSYSCGIYSDEDLTIVLEGNSTIQSNSADALTFGVYGQGKLTIEGEGGLTIASSYRGICSNYLEYDKDAVSVAIDGCELDIKVTGGETDTDNDYLYQYYCGIYSNCGVSVQDGGVAIAVTSPKGGYGILSNRDSDSSQIAIKNSSVQITTDGNYCSGLSAKSVEISGDTTKITSEGEIYCPNGLRITGTPTISVTSEEGSLGIYCPYGDITINDLLYSCTGNNIEITNGEVIYGLRENCVWVDGEKLNNQNTTISCGDGTAVYDPEDNILTLENATISSGYTYNGNSCGIFTDGSLTIDLVGNNTIQSDGMDYAIYSSGSESDVTIRGSGSLSARTQNCGIYTAGDLTITGGTVEVDGAVVGIHVIGGALTVTGGSLTAIGGTLCGVQSNLFDLVLEGGTVTAIGREEGSYGIVAPGLTMKRGSTLTVSGNQAAIRLRSTAPDLPEGYLPDGYSVRKVDYQGQGGDTWSLYTIARKGATLTYDPNTATGTLTGAATSVTLMEYAVDEGDDDDDRDTGSTTESERNPDGSLTTTVTNPDGTTVETTRYPDGSKEVVETQKDGTVVTTATDKSGNETKTTENTDGTSVIAVTRTDGSTSATTVDKSGLSVTVAALSDSAVAQTGTVYLPMPAVTAASDLKSAPAVTLDLPASTAVKVEIPVENVTAGTVAVLVKADGTSEIVKTSVATADGVVLTLSGGETVKLVDNSKTFSDVTSNFWGADAVAFASSRELFNGTSATAFSPNAPMDRAMIVTVLARLDGADTTTGSIWYEAGAQWAMANGISDGSGLDQNLTREQLATMLYRYAQLKGYDVSAGENTNLLSYSDASSVSGYAMEAMQWACGAGIIGGKDGLLAPAGSATRAEVATMLMRFVAGL